MTPQDYNSEYNRPTQSPQEYPRVEGALKIMLCSTFTWLFRGWRKHGKLIWKRSDKLDADEFGRALQYHLSTGWAARAGTLACQCTVQAIAQLMFCCSAELAGWHNWLRRDTMWCFVQRGKCQNQCSHMPAERVQTYPSNLCTLLAMVATKMLLLLIITVLDVLKFAVVQRLVSFWLSNGFCLCFSRLFLGPRLGFGFLPACKSCRQDHCAQVKPLLCTPKVMNAYRKSAIPVVCNYILSVGDCSPEGISYSGDGCCSHGGN